MWTPTQPLAQSNDMGYSADALPSSNHTQKFAGSVNMESH